MRFRGELGFNGAVVLIPAFEELIFRYLLQEQLLKTIPVQILNKVAPEYASAINTKTAKAARIAISSALFAIAHIGPKPLDSLVWVLPKFALGCILGAIQESTGNTFYSLGWHMGNNLIPGIIFKILSR